MKPTQQPTLITTNRSKATPPGALLFRSLFALAFALCFATAEKVTAASVTIVEGGTITTTEVGQLVKGDVITVSGSVNFYGAPNGLGLNNRNITITSGTYAWSTIYGPGAIPTNPGNSGNQNRFTIGAAEDTTWTFDRITITGADSGAYGGAALAVVVNSKLTTVNGDWKAIGNRSIAGNANNSGGGGINVVSGTLVLTGNVEIAHNLITSTGALAGNVTGGGGINVSAGAASITLGNAAIQAVSPKTVYIHDNRAYDTVGTTPTFGQGGGLRSNNSATFISDVIVTSNTASGNGGGIYVAKLFTMANSTLLADNYTAFDGGGLYAGANVISEGVFTATNNTAARSGGAIYAYQTTAATLAFAGGSKFVNNRAGNLGGAIAWQHTNNSVLNFNANTGDIIFQGNTANGVANAMHIDPALNRISTINVTASSGKTVAFYDPITTGSNLGTQFILNISGQGGSLLFDTYNSPIPAQTTVNTGAALRLSNNATFGKNTDSGFLTLKTGAILSGAGTIRTGTMTVEGNALLEARNGGTLKIEAGTISAPSAIRLAGNGTIDAGISLIASNVTVGVTSVATTNSAQSLTLAGNTPLTLAGGGMINIDLFANGTHDILNLGSLTLAGSGAINLAGSGSGAFKILTATTTDLSTLGLTRLVNGSAPTARVTANLRYENAGHELWVDFASRNLVTTWTGGNGRTWKSSTDTADANWSDTAGSDFTFEFGDSVKFTNAGAGAVTIADTGVIAADITVDATSDYTFAGAGGIKTDAASSFGITTPLTGKLTKKGTGALNLANTGVNTFANGIDIEAGVLSFTTPDQITTTGTSITFAGTGTLRAAANGLSFGNTLDITPAASGAIDVLPENTLTYDGTLRGGATATITKTGAGNLVIASDNSASFTGTANIAAGMLSIAHTGILGGKTLVQNGAILSGNGTAGAGATGGVTVRPGGIISPGMPGALTPQTLTLNNLSVDGAQLHYDLFASDASDRINTTGAAITVGSGTNTIVLATFQTGTFNLGNLAALDGKVTIREIGGMSPRHTGSLAVSGNDLILTTVGDQSRTVTWTGANNANWDYSTNWLDSGTSLSFASGDAIVFDSTSDTAARRTINLNTAPVRATAITVQGDADYTFTGSNSMTADPTSNVLGGIAAPTGKLVKSGNGTLTFANAAANDFLGGIEINGGAISFANGDQLGDGGNGIRFTGTGALAPTASTTLTNNITINADARATITTGNNSLTLTGDLTAGGTTAALYKSGTGTLTLSGNDNSNYTGNVHVTAGHLVLENDAQLGGRVGIVNNSTLSGSGTLGGSVSINTGARLRIGNDTAPGALTIGSLSLNDTASIGGAGSLAVSTGLISGLVTADIAPALDLTLTGALLGTGTLNKTGAGNLIFTDTASFGHYTIVGSDTTNAGHYSIVINDGMVILRGIKGLVTGTAGGHNILLNGGWLDLSDSPSTDPINDWSGFNITGTLGGVIGANDMITLRAGENNLTIGTAEKPGIFVAVAAGEGNTATITGSSAYKGYTRLDSGILKVTADSQLGDLAANRNVVFNGGNLRISGSFDTARTLEMRTSGTLIADAGLETTWTAIAGANTAFLTKTGEGTLINKGGSVIKGVNVEAGRFVALKTDGLGAGSGTSTVAGGAVIEFRNIGTRTIVDTTIAGSGTVLINSSTISVSGNNSMGSVILKNSTVTVASPNAFGGSGGIITADAGSRMSITATTPNFGRLALNGGHIVFTTPSGTNYRHATITDLQGGGRLRMNVNFTDASGLAPARTKADYVTILGGSGDYVLDISTSSSGTTSNPHSSFDLIDAGASTVNFELANGIYEIGTNRYRLTQGYGDTYAPDPTHWYLVYNTISNTAEAILNTANTSSIDWYISMDSVSQRLGDIRNNLTDIRDHHQARDSFKSPRIGDTWIRTRGYQLNATNQYSGADFTQYGGGISAGIDRAFKTDNTATLIGLMIDTGLISRNFSDYGTGHTYTLTAGLYATWMHAKGWYSDLTLAASTYGQNFTARTANAGAIDGRYQNTILGATLELGRRFQLEKGFWIEPAIQAGFAGINGATYDTTGDDVGITTHVVLKGQGALQYRGLLRVGHQIADSRWNPYMKFAVVGTENSGGEIYADDRKFSPDYSGRRIEAGFGTTYALGKLSQLYFDYEYAKSDIYERPWSINAGIRYLW